MEGKKTTGPNIFIRMMLGAVGISFCNQLLKTYGIDAVVGLNLVSLLTIGSLGTSGFTLLYAIVFSKFL